MQIYYLETRGDVCIGRTRKLSCQQARPRIRTRTAERAQLTKMRTLYLLLFLQ